MTLVERIVDVSSRGLPGMFRKEYRCFAHTLRRVGTRLELAGVSPRYSAIALLGLRHTNESAQRAALGGETAQEFAEHQVASIESHDNLGDVALIIWSAAECGVADLTRALARLRALWNASSNAFVVDAAWTLSAFLASRECGATRADAHQVKATLEQCLPHGSAIFPRWVHPSRSPFGRSHVGCFADQVYPIQALSRYHAAFLDEHALGVANACAEQICRVQGEGGQWWWHYDARNGSVVEGYPVYSVHQDAMAPMALMDLVDAGGRDFSEEIRRGLRWMQFAPEVGHSLIDDDIPLIWRKVGRNEPNKATRKIRAVLTGLHPSLRWQWLDRVAPPTAVDWESRPYHLGWVLYAWLS